METIYLATNDPSFVAYKMSGYYEPSSWEYVKFSIEACFHFAAAAGAKLLGGLGAALDWESLRNWGFDTYDSEWSAATWNHTSPTIAILCAVALIAVSFLLWRIKPREFLVKRNIAPHSFILTVGIISFALITLFPPWETSVQCKDRVERKSGDYAWIASPPDASTNTNLGSRIDVPRYLVELIGTLLVFGTAYFLLCPQRSRKSENT